MNDLVLEGCRPIPLAAYLKALGVLRLVADQADSTARGWWEGDRFRLRTTLDRDGLVHFFLHEYRPTPIVAPWNGRAGFLEGETKGGEISDRTGAQLIRAYADAQAQRFSGLRRAVEAFSNLPAVKELDIARADSKRLARATGRRKLTDDEKQKKSDLDRKAKRAKAQLISYMRAEVTEDQFAWLDARVMLADQNANSPLLIAGGSDGSRDYGMAFGTALQKLFSFQDGVPAEGNSGLWLRAAIFGDAALLLGRESLGHFEPGQGGYNATTGYEGDNPFNPWDMVIALEGAFLWSGGVTRRLDSAADTSAASFPFSFNLSRAGSGQLSTPDPNRTPGEIWCPLWDRPVGIKELTTFFREGRLTLGKRVARTGLDAALAVQMLGRGRGVKSFTRIGLYQSDAKMPHTTAGLGRYEVGAVPDTAFLALELADHPWLIALRREAHSKESPGELQAIVRAIEDRMFEMASPTAQHSHVQAALVALGEAARILAVRLTLRPPPQLSKRWIDAADDGSPEFRIGVALAGMRARPKAGDGSKQASSGSADSRAHQRVFLPMRAHLGPLDPERHPPQWSKEKGGSLAVWGAGPLVDNLCAVAERRLLEQTRRDLPDRPFDSAFDEAQGASVAVSSGEIAAFLDREVRDERIAELVLGLAWVQPCRWGSEDRGVSLPFSYAALKPLFTPRSVFEWLKKRDRLNGDVPEMPTPPALPSLLVTGRVQEAVRLAQQRARASGLPTPFLQKRAAPGRAADPVFGRRLLAALTIPVRGRVITSCLSQAYPSSDQETNDAR